MGVVRDITVEQLAQAVSGIDTSGLAKDSTLQATNTALDNINTTLGGITTNDPPTDTTQQSIASAISGLGTALGSDKANISGDNIASPATFRANIGVNKLIIGGTLSALALNNGNIRVSLPAIKGYNNISCDKLNNIIMDIYGNISSGRATASLNPRLLSNIIVLDFTPNIQLSNYTALSKLFCIDCEAIEITLS